MKLIILNQAKIEGELEPKIIKLGKVAINIESIATFYSSIGKYDDVIKGVCHIFLENGLNLLVAEEFDVLLEQIKQTDLV